MLTLVSYNSLVNYRNKYIQHAEGVNPDNRTLLLNINQQERQTRRGIIETRTAIFRPELTKRLKLLKARLLLFLLLLKVIFLLTLSSPN